MISLNVIDTLQKVDEFHDAVLLQAAPIKDSYVTNLPLSILVHELETKTLDQDDYVHCSKIRITLVQRQETPDPTQLLEIDQAVTILIKNMESLPHVYKAHRMLGMEIPHIDTNILMRVSVFEITYNIKG